MKIECFGGQLLAKFGRWVMRYLLSGCAGFLGTNLALRLLREGHEVVGIDNMFCGSLRNLELLRKHDKFEFYEFDIRNEVLIRSINGKFNYVLNLACPASPPRYNGDPFLTMETCSIGVRNMIERAKKDGARFFHTSTSEVYGDPDVHPQTEEYSGNVQPYGQRASYDEGKRYAEALIWQYRHRPDVNTGLIRIFNTYGPLMDPDDGRVVTNFIKQALNGEDITIQGDGTQTRSFCYVDDQIEAQMRFIHSDLEGPINVGNPTEFTVLELADLVIKLTGSKSKIIHIAPAISDPKKRKPDISKAKELLDWEPEIGLLEGIRRTIAWFRSIGY